VKETVCKAQTEISSVTSNQKVIFKRHCAGFAFLPRLEWPSDFTQLNVSSDFVLRRHRAKKSEAVANWELLHMA
jgi:hypothetical protein